ncbi:MAG: PAS domain S-box protein [Clostridia bacterium]|nr:PAS domain S-box protein [Clostridia bacterium]
MNKKIFLSGFLTSMLVLFITVGMIFGMLFNQFEDQIVQELKSEAIYISYAVEADGKQVIHNFNNNNKRITLVDKNGIVIADTLADISNLDNHSDRKEIKDAMEQGWGTSSRYSDTLMERTLYYAVKMENGSILRVSTTQNSVVVVLIELLQPLILIVIVALVLSFLLSKRVSNAIVKPINNLDLENPASNVVYDELTPLLRKLSAQKITIDNQIKEAMQKQEEFRLITENMSEGLLMIDAYTNVLMYNKAALRLLGIEKIANTSILVINRKKSFRDVVNKAISGERCEETLLFEDRSYDLIATPVYEENKVIGAVIMIVDVTEREKREQLRREFTSNVSHELKTPLTSISGFAEMIKAGDMPMETIVDFSQSIYDEAQRLTGLVSDIIKISEISEKPAGEEKDEVSLRAVCENALKTLKPIADKRGITLNLDGEEAVITGSGKILKEMIFNLCDNAVKYNKEHGEVNVTITQTDKAIRLTVSDTGIGIPSLHHERVFERFYRVDKSHSKSVEGTGLGLAIVKHGALYHNAEIELESIEGEGTSISLVFNR